MSGVSEFIEGRNAVREALRAGAAIERILLARTAEGESIGDIERLAADRGVPVATVPKHALDERSARGAHQGVIAQIAPYVYTPLAEIVLRHGGRPRSLIVLLDHITDEGNLGAIARSAEVAGAAGLIVPKARSAGVGAVAHKTSAGALSYLPVAREPNIVRAIETLKEAEYWVAGASEKAAAALWDAPLDGRIALVVGAEGHGLSRLVERSCDFLVRIPVVGQVASLNVAQATAVLAFEWVRRGTESP